MSDELESPKGFVSVPSLEQLKPTPRESHLLAVLWDWLERSKTTEVVLGHPTGFKPCDAPCPKCGSMEIYRRFRHAMESWDDKETPVSKFINAPYSYTRQATRDCITHHCRECQYSWQTTPLPKGGEK